MGRGEERRPVPSQAKSKAALALAKLKENRKAGKRVVDIDLDEDDVYDVVDENHYKDIVEKRRAEENFIIDEEGIFGYEDDGEENWEEYDNYLDYESENDEEDSEEKKKSKPRAPSQKKKKFKKIDSSFLGSGAHNSTDLNEASSSAISKKSKKPQDFPMEQLDSLLDDLISNPTSEVVQEERKTKKLKTEDIALFGQTADVEKAQIQIERERMKNENTAFEVTHNFDDHNDSFDHEEPAYEIPTISSGKMISRIEEASKKETERIVAEEKPPVTTSIVNNEEDFQFSSGFRAMQTVSATTTSNAEGGLNADGDLEFFWFDAYEDQVNAPGTVFLLGKIKSGESEYQSCCIQVRNIQRNVFILPRSEHLQTGQQVQIIDVYKEIAEIMKGFKTGMKFMTKTVDRKNVFDDDEEVPTESVYLKMLYDAKYPELPRDLSGNTFSRIYGSKSTCLELFMIKRKLSGPSWLKIKSVIPASINEKASWCKQEYIVQNPKNVSVDQDNQSCPNFCAMALNIKTVLNPKTKANEIVMLSWLIHRSISIESSTPKIESLERFTLIRRLNGTNWPFDLLSTLQKNSLDSSVRLCDSEREILSFFSSMLQKVDPDVLIGHDIMSFELEVLLNRFSEFKLDRVWSKLGRVQRKKIPAARGKRDFGFLIKQDITSGRLICDTQQSAQEFVHETNYTLKTLASLYLKESCEEILPADIPRYFSDTNSLLHLINVSLKDAFLSIKLMDKLLVLPLTKQLTSLCGNLWSHSLRSQRADRIEHLLLHEFHRRKFIVPEKYSKAELKAKGEKNEMIEGENAPEEEKTSRRKPQYSGGLVLEPKRGLYKDFVLLLDFNSLYPSIIQEYDICFTTRSTLPLPHEKDANYQAVDEQLVPVPNPTGVLPTVIRNLVQRRRDVKKVMEQTSDTFRKQQLDIKQKALKLVANAMYGCLGFANSRFHCKDLASLITQQGRSILSRTVELTERLGYEIIYGDTDSIMVNSKTRDLVQARQIANSIRGEVNKLYTKLEIGMDGIFKTLLLLKKKKYAALTVVEKNGLITAAKEVKGLDLVRRDWCVLSKELGHFVVDELLSEKNEGEIIESIHQKMQEVSEGIKSYPIDKFVITKSLTKAPQQYGDANAQPHVKVALEMIKQGRHVSVGDHIPYVVCQVEGGSLADKAFHPYSPDLASGKVQLDIEWYLSHQILPPISRICEPIDGVDIRRLAISLGLDASKFSSESRESNNPASVVDDSFAFDLYDFDDEEVFKGLAKIELTCQHCLQKSPFLGMCSGINDKGEIIDGLQCPTAGCKGFLCDRKDMEMLRNSVFMLIKKSLSKFYQKVYVCDDLNCPLRFGTRRIPRRAGSHCFRTGCSGKLYPECSRDYVYKQIRYLQAVFDESRIKKKAQKKKVSLPAKQYPQGIREEILHIKKKIDDLLLQCSQHWIDPIALFTSSFATKVEIF